MPSQPPFLPPPLALRPDPPTPAVWPTSDSPLPTVSIVLLNFNGGEHNQACLESLRQLDYPKDRFEVLVIDHASVDGSVAAIRAGFPEVRLIEAGVNLGFAAGCNFGTRASGAEFVAFLNNDARVDPAWLRALVGAIDRRDGSLCAAAKMLDWEGREVDFVEGHMVFHGFARQAHWREWVGSDGFQESKPLLFACGGAMLIDRSVFLRLGGFDERFWMFFEDVDLGWRLWSGGYRVVFAPQAVAYHRHHGTAGAMSEVRRNFLYERNALMMVLKNYEDENLWPILSASLALMAHRAGDRMQRRAQGEDLLDPEHWHALGPAEMEREVHLGDLASLVALRHVLALLPEIMAERRKVQALRQRPDREILPLFGQARRPYPMAHMLIQPYCEAQQHLWYELGLDGIFAVTPARVALLCADGLPSFGQSHGPEGSRAQAVLDHLIAAGDDVTPCLPRRDVDALADPPARVRRFAWNDRNLDNRLIRLGPDVIVATHWRCLAFARLSIYRPVVLIWSDSDPMPGFLADLAPLFEREQERRHAIRVFSNRDYLRNADLFVFRNAAQRDRVLAELQAELGWAPPFERTAIGDGSDDLGPDLLAAIAAFCRGGWYSEGKLPITFRAPIPHTPLVLLPLKAWKAIRRGGGTDLRREVTQYLRWIWHNVKRRLP
ncbi:MAG: glycosyltransferase family 2 protein [Anaerolineae bacterium]